MSRKGTAALAGLYVIYALWGTTIAAGILLRPKHIVRKANERCIAYGGSADICKGYVEEMSQKERINYIRDTVARPQPAGSPLGG